MKICYNKHKGKIIGLLIGVLIPIYVYTVATNLLWPDLAWSAKEWHQLLGSAMITSFFGLLFGSISDI